MQEEILLDLLLLIQFFVIYFKLKTGIVSPLSPPTKFSGANCCPDSWVIVFFSPTVHTSFFSLKPDCGRRKKKSPEGKTRAQGAKLGVKCCLGGFLFFSFIPRIGKTRTNPSLLPNPIPLFWCAMYWLWGFQTQWKYYVRQRRFSITHRFWLYIWTYNEIWKSTIQTNR